MSDVTSFEAQAQNKAELAKAMRNVNAMLKALDIGSVEGLAKVAVLAHGEIVRELSHPGTGRTYFIRTSKKGNRYWGANPPGTAHVASAPGEAPAVDTGKYRASWRFDTGVDTLGPFSSVFTTDKRAAFLEYGTRRMAARPHLRPVIMRMAGVFQEALLKSVVAKQQEAVAMLFTSKGL